MTRDVTTGVIVKTRKPTPLGNRKAQAARASVRFLGRGAARDGEAVNGRLSDELAMDLVSNRLALKNGGAGREKVPAGIYYGHIQA